MYFKGLKFGTLSVTSVIYDVMLHLHHNLMSHYLPTPNLFKLNDLIKK